MGIVRKYEKQVNAMSLDRMQSELDRLIAGHNSEKNSLRRAAYKTRMTIVARAMTERLTKLPNGQRAGLVY